MSKERGTTNSEGTLSLDMGDWRALFDAIEHPTMILDVEHRIIAANQALLSRLDAAESELVGKLCWEVLHSDGRNRATRSCCMERLLSDRGRSKEVGDTHLEKLGGHFRVSCTAVYDDQHRLKHVVHMTTDITNHKRSEQAAHESERLFRTLFNQAGDYILLVDPTHPSGPTIVDANDSACVKHGYTRDELLGMPMSKLDSEDDRELIPQRARQIMSGEDAVFEAMHVRKDGSMFPVEVSAKLIDIGGKPHIFAIERDITERKHAEEEQKRLEAQLLQSQKLESLGILTSGIAHDFNNLLVGIMGNAELLMRDLSRESSQATLCQKAESITTSATRASELIRQMLVYAGEGRLEVQPLDLKSTIQEIADLLRVATSKSVSLELDFREEIPAIEADATQIRQVIMNLITNASEAIGEGAGVIRVRTESKDYGRADLDQTFLYDDLPEGTYVSIEVSDTGEGMDEATQRFIFDPFFSTKHKGRGLGLSSVLGIIRAHRGAVKITSNPSEGTTFTLLFPSAQSTAPKDGREEAVTNSWGAGRRILLVDDEESVRQVIGGMLQHLDFDVSTADGCEEALEAFSPDPERFACVLIDAIMPGADGPACIAKLRRIRGDVPILLMSGNAEAIAKCERNGIGIDGALHKPFRLSELSRKLRSALNTDQ